MVCKASAVSFSDQLGENADRSGGADRGKGRLILGQVQFAEEGVVPQINSRVTVEINLSLDVVDKHYLVYLLTVRDQALVPTADSQQTNELNRVEILEIALVLFLLFG